MSHVSLFDLFKIGLGPSSSHTVGPMRAAALFVTELEAKVADVARVGVDLYGSLALTGRGHATPAAVMLGLEAYAPDKIEPQIAADRVEAIRAHRQLQLGGICTVDFNEDRDIVWHMRETLARHPNGIRFSVWNSAGELLLAREYYSIGGGFVETADARANASPAAACVRYPYDSAKELLEVAVSERKAIWEVVLENELCNHTADELDTYVDRVWQVMQQCVERGLFTEGILPGGLNVRRRAPRLYRRLVERWRAEGLEAMEYVNAVAMAVNEENAAGGRVVTAPTNGASGVIPAVLHYYMRFCGAPDRDGIKRFFLTATAIGALYKNNASISGAEVGCQGEVGVACSMAAGGLVAALGGTSEEVEHAAEIGMEHSLGMTCDPIGGLVQIPCIERNAVGAVRAIQAARMAMEHEGDHRVDLDQVIEVMRRTGMDMQKAYKETSLGGLALAVVEC